MNIFWMDMIDEILLVAGIFVLLIHLKSAVMNNKTLMVYGHKYFSLNYVFDINKNFKLFCNLIM